METHDPHAMAQTELSAGERLVWVGRPAPAALARTRWHMAAFGLFMTPFALFWLATTLFFIGPATENGPPLAFLVMFPLIGLAALGVGLYSLSTPLRYWRKAKRTVYAVTDLRVLIVEPGRVQSFEPGDLQQLERQDKGNGSGNLIFREEQGNLMLAMHTFGGSANQKIGFFGISDVRAAEDAVRQLKRSAA